jgi:hypothetical protein
LLANAPGARRQLDDFIAKYSPAIAKLARAAFLRLRKRLPGASVLVYDSYNALAIGFSPSERASEIVFSLALYPRWVSLFFTQGASLTDPKRRLKGSGNAMRHIVLERIAVLDESYVRALMADALKRAGTTLATGRGEIIIKSVSTRQRPRRPLQAE